MWDMLFKRWGYRPTDEVPAWVLRMTAVLGVVEDVRGEMRGREAS